MILVERRSSTLVCKIFNYFVGWGNAYAIDRNLVKLHGKLYIDYVEKVCPAQEIGTFITLKDKVTIREEPR